MGCNARFDKDIVWSGWRGTLEALAGYAQSRIEPGDIYNELFSDEQLELYDIWHLWPLEKVSRNDLLRLLQWANEVEDSGEAFQPRTAEAREVMRKDLISLREKLRERIAQLSGQMP